MSNIISFKTPIVHTEGNRVFASSRDVAAYFEKRHDHVLDAITDLLETDPEASPNFRVCSYQAVEGGRCYRMFEMDRDGFTLLAMGFTGPKALKFKRAYIKAFNQALERLEEVESRQLSPSLPDFTNPVIAARAWADELEGRIRAEDKVKELEPLALVGDAVARHRRPILDFMRKFVGVNLSQVQRTLGELGYLYRRGASGWKVRRQFVDLFEEGFESKYGTSKIYPTKKGQELLAKLFHDGALPRLKGYAA